MTKIPPKPLLWPFLRVLVYLGHFKGLGVLLPLYRFEGILVILGFGVILVIFQVSRVFWTIFRIQGYFGHFFSRFGGYFCHFLGLGDILVNFQFFGYFGHFSKFGGYFGQFLGFGIILVTFQVLGVFRSFFMFRWYFG